MLDNSLSNYYDQQAQSYDPEQRLSSSTASLIVKAIRRRIQHSDCFNLVDIGCGNAYLSSRLLADMGRGIFLDISSAMLEQAKHRLKSLKGNFVCADARAIPFKQCSMSIVLMSFVLHLLTDPEYAIIEIERILMPGGHFFFVTYDPQDLVEDLHHKYFPGYRDIDLKRFSPLSKLKDLFHNRGFEKINPTKYQYKIRYNNVEEAVAVVKDKPFSGFLRYNDDDFKKYLIEFESNLRNDFGNGEVIYQSKVTLLSMIKP